MRAHGTLFTLATTVLASCGGGDGPPQEDHILFDGPPGALRPHDVGATSRFLVKAVAGDESTSSTLTTRVLHEGPDGEFLVESTYDGGAARRARARETDHSIQIEAVAVEAPAGFVWLDVDPAAEVLHTPVVRGDVRKTRFVRTIDAVVEIDGTPAVRPIAFEGWSTRTARGHESIALGDRTVRALAFDLRGESELARIPGAPDLPHPPLRLSFSGTRHLVEHVGLVREELALTLATAEERASFDIVTEREIGGG